MLGSVLGRLLDTLPSFCLSDLYIVLEWINENRIREGKMVVFAQFTAINALK